MTDQVRPARVETMVSFVFTDPDGTECEPLILTNAQVGAIIAWGIGEKCRDCPKFRDAKSDK